jgi:hypothetical protein
MARLLGFTTENETFTRKFWWIRYTLTTFCHCWDMMAKMAGLPHRSMGFTLTENMAISLNLKIFIWNILD